MLNKKSHIIIYFTTKLPMDFCYYSVTVEIEVARCKSMLKYSNVLNSTIQ